jgi:hypothetical protein
MGRKHQHRFHGSPDRFNVIADFINDRYGNMIRYIADVAGGQGMLTRLLRKQYNYEAEVIDPRGWAMKSVPNRAEEFAPSMASYYDLIVGLHPDQATRAVAESGRIRPVILIPCCNFWSEEKLGRDALVEAVAEYYRRCGVKFEQVIFPFKGPTNIGLVSEPPDPA